MRVVRLQKGDDIITCGLDQEHLFRASGWGDAVPEPVRETAARTIGGNTAGLIRMVKDGNEILCGLTQVEALTAAGWQRVDEPSSGEVSSVAASTSLRSVLEGLDPDDSDLWTQQGPVRLKPLEDFMGREVTREEVNAAWSGLTRETLRQFQSGQ